MHFGMFGMWGTYVFSILILYSPDAKSTPERNGKRSKCSIDKDDDKFILVIFPFSIEIFK